MWRHLLSPLYTIVFKKTLQWNAWKVNEWSMKSNPLWLKQRYLLATACPNMFFLFCVPFFFLLLTSSFTFSFCKEFLFCWPGRDLNLGPEMREELAHITLPTELFGLTNWVSISLTFSFIYYILVDTFIDYKTMCYLSLLQFLWFLWHFTITLLWFYLSHQGHS